MKYQKIIVMTLFGLIFGSCAEKNDAYTVLDVPTYKDSITKQKVQLIDVRTPEEYNSGHIEYAENIDFYSGKFTTEFNKLDKEEPIYIYCRSGSRSKQTGAKLSAMGFKEIYDLKGGILNYN